MTPYGFIILWSGIVTGVFILGRYSFSRRERIFGKEKSRVIPAFACFAVFPLFWITAFRDNVGDTGVYRSGFLSLPSGINSIPDYIQTINKDKGFAVVEIIIKTFIGNDDRLFLLVLAAIQIGILCYVYRKYSDDYLLSLFLFIVSTDYISWLFNGIRQFLAATLIFAGIKLMIQKKTIPLIIIILIASTIHGSALIMLPIVFIASGKAVNKKILVFIIMCICFIPFISRLTPMLENLLANTQYDSVMKDELWLNDDGTSLIRTAVYSVPAVLAFLFRKYIYTEDDVVLNLSVNMSIITAGLYLVSSFSSGVYVGRLPIYTSLFSYITLPGIIKAVFTESSKALVYAIMIMIYLLFYYYQMTIAWNFSLI